MKLQHDVAILRSIADLEKLESEWSMLQAGARDPLLSHRWFAAAAATLHSEADLRIISVRRAGRLTGVAPMAEVRRSAGRWLELIGAAVLHEPTGLLAEDPAAQESLCMALVDQRRPFALQRVQNDESLPRMLRRACRRRGLLLTIEAAPCLRVEIRGSWDDYVKTRSAEVRAGLRRKRRMLEAAGAVTVDRLRPSVHEVDAVLAEASNIEADGWKGAAGSAIRQNDKLWRFFVELASRFAATGELRVSYLRAGTQVVAMNLLLEYDRRLWELKIGYREAWGRASPGLLLLWETLQDAHARGLQSYEFLGSGDGRQPAWATGERRLQTLVYFPYNYSGMWALCSAAAGRLAGKLR